MGDNILLNKSPVWILFGIITTFVIIATSILTYLTWKDIKKDHLADLKHINRIVLQSELATFHHQESVLKILGQNLLHHNAGTDPENGRDIIEKMMRINKGMAGFGLARNDGQLIIVSKIPKGKKLPNLTANKRSKESFLKTLRSDTMQIGQTYFMKQLNKWVIPIRARIIDDKGNIPLVMTAGLNIDGGETSWNTFGLGEEITVQVVREDGYTQFQNPALQSEFQSIYQTKLNQTFLNQIFSLHLNNKDSITIDSFYDNNNIKMLSVVSYLKDYGLYTIVSTSYSILNAHLKEVVIKNSTIMVVIIVVLFLLFKIINSIQLITQKNFKYIATHDSLTKLPNRLFLANEIEKKVAQKTGFFLIYLDLDNFNHINDTYGHTFGDNLLKQVGIKLKMSLENGSFIARQSGDEFIILYESDSIDEATLFIKKIFDIFALAFVINDTEIFMGTSMGISKYPQDGENAELLLSESDTALYKAKQSKGTFLFFDKSMRKNSKKSLLIESELRHTKR
jgi:diguanylate cyclase (GGDEF)-like protein